MPTRAIRRVGNDVRDEAEHLVLLAGKQFSDKLTVAAAILAAAGGTSPKRPLRFLIDLCLCHFIQPFHEEDAGAANGSD